MSIRVTVDELQEQLPELIGHAVESDEAYIIQRDGQDCAVLVSAREWERRTQGPVAGEGAAPALSTAQRRRREVGERLDALGPEYRLSREKQTRLTDLLSRKAALIFPEQSELETLVREADEITLRRAEALDRGV
jgi:PHD/YefM family antitoxin component YafN of YafNO toxin-antitoxin module